MLEMTGVQKRYGTFLLDCSITVEKGRIVGLIGANGAGKSTTFKAALGLIAPDAGEVRVFGKQVAALDARDRERIGVVLADSGFSDYLCVRDIADMMEKLYQDFDRGTFLMRCREYGLPERKKIREFSTGMRAKLKLAAAMTHGADLLILDEPTAGLDVVAREEMLGILQDYLGEREDRAVLISSHISGDLEKLCDEIYLIHEGRILLRERTDRLLDSYGCIKVDEEQRRSLDASHLLWQKRERFGYSILTDARRFYQENYPGIVVEKGSIDDIILLVEKGERI